MTDRPMKAARAWIAAAFAFLLLVPAAAQAADGAALRFAVAGGSEVLVATAGDLLAAEQVFSPHGAPAVELRFAPAFAARFADFTGRNAGKSVTVSRGGETLQTFRIMERIAGGVVLISGRFSVAEAKALAAALRPAKAGTTDEKPGKGP